MSRVSSTLLATAAGAPLGPFVGVLGGMGPLATVDLMQKIIMASGAQRDQEHIPVVAHNVAQIPDRQAFLRGAGPSPLPALIAALDRLNAIGAGVIVIPCNTAHIWYDELCAASRAPILHIADAALVALDGLSTSRPRIGLLATPGTLEAGFYQTRFGRRGCESLINTEAELQRWFNPGCQAIKAGQIEEGGRLLESAGRALIDRGAEHVVLACTEVPIGLAAIRSEILTRATDATEALARAAIAWWHDAAGRLAEQRH